jgi:hypothetical protein
METSLAELKQTAPLTIASGLQTKEGWALMNQIAKVFLDSGFLPDRYKSPPQVIVALEMANRLNMPLMFVAQNLYTVHNQPSWSAKSLHAMLDKLSRYSPIRYETVGEPDADSWACRAYATDLRTGERLDGVWVSLKMAKDEGWHGKNGSKWKTMPEKMLRYRALSFWVSDYEPGITCGLPTVEEVEDYKVLDAEVKTEETTLNTVEMQFDKPELLKSAYVKYKTLCTLMKETPSAGLTLDQVSAELDRLATLKAKVYCD